MQLTQYMFLQSYILPRILLLDNNRLNIIYEIEEPNPIFKRVNHIDQFNKYLQHILMSFNNLVILLQNNKCMICPLDFISFVVFTNNGGGVFSSVGFHLAFKKLVGSRPRPRHCIFFKLHGILRISPMLET